MSKFNAKKAIAERDRYLHLKLLERAGEIKNLELQPAFILLKKFVSNKVKYRGIKYIADFRYYENDRICVEDVKGAITKEYALKKQLFLEQRERDVFGDNVIFREVRRVGSRFSVLEL